MSKEISNTSALAQGTMVLGIATLLSKILGFLYVVPFTALVGTQGFILYEYAYKPYVIILSIATIGLPAAVSKIVSKYNALGDYQTGQRLFKSSLALLTATGIFCFLLLYFLSPVIASYIIDPNDTSGNSVEDVTLVIRMVSFALIVVPPMALARGFFQGYKNFNPTAVSQVVEQFFRIIFILVGAFVAIYVLDKDISFAVGLATFAAFVGAISGSFVLFYYFKKEKENLRTLHAESKKTDTRLRYLYKELIFYAIPLVITGLSISLYQTVDTFTINKAIMNTGANQLTAETVNSITALVQKIILIPTFLATAMSLSLLPTITSAFTQKDNNSLQALITKSILMVSFLSLPCIALLIALSEGTFSFLFPSADSQIGSELMIYYAATTLVISIYLVTTPILQGMSLHKVALTSLFIGLVIKIFTNIPLVELFGGAGSAHSTNLGLMVSIIINLYYINKKTSFVPKFDFKNIIVMTVLSGLLFAIAFALDKLFMSLMSPDDWNLYLFHGLRLLFAGGISSFFFLFASQKMNLIENILGQKYSNKLKRIPFF